jgi:hypothetical protein
VIVVLAGVTFDGLLQTPLWLEIVRLTPITQTSGVILLPLLFFGIYLGFVELSRILGGGGEAGFRQFAAAYAFSQRVASILACPRIDATSAYQTGP